MLRENLGIDVEEITSGKYWIEVEGIASILAEEALDQADDDKEAAQEYIFDSALHETIDGHQWIIYNYYNLQVIGHSDNEDYYDQNFGAEALAASLAEGGLSTLHCHIAFWALYADVSDKIEDALDSEIEHREEVKAMVDL